MIHTWAIDLNIDASLDFLSRVLPLEEMPTGHQPAKKWMAVRLRVERRETWERVKGGRTRYWKKMIAAGEEEAWLHVKPSETEMEQYKHGHVGRNGSS